VKPAVPVEEFRLPLGLGGMCALSSGVIDCKVSMAHRWHMLLVVGDFHNYLFVPFSSARLFQWHPLRADADLSASSMMETSYQTKKTVFFFGANNKQL
jgi:hypothetical protein